jgi:hypothetical protein
VKIGAKKKKPYLEKCLKQGGQFKIQGVKIQYFPQKKLYLTQKEMLQLSKPHLIIQGMMFDFRIFVVI